MKAQFSEIKMIASSYGADDNGGISALFNQSGTNLITFTIRLTDKGDRDRSVFVISDKIRDLIGKEVEVVNYTVTPNAGMMSGQQPNQVDVEIYGHDFDVTNRLAQEIKQKMLNIKGAKDVEISRKDDKEELQVVLDREKLAELGLNSATVSTMVRNRIAGLTASQLREDGDEFDIVVRFKEEFRNSINDVENITIMTPSGQKVKLKEIGQVKELWSPPNITHKRKERYLTVSAKPVGVSLVTLATFTGTKSHWQHSQNGGGGGHQYRS